jgi:hypothetical protein
MIPWPQTFHRDISLEWEAIRWHLQGQARLQIAHDRPHDVTPVQPKGINVTECMFSRIGRRPEYDPLG